MNKFERPDQELNPDENIQESSEQKSKYAEMFTSITGKKLEFGTPVQVKRTSGEIEDGWIIRGTVDNNVIVEKEEDGKVIEKTMRITDLTDLNSL